MKHFKRLFAYLLSAVMVLTLFSSFSVLAVTAESVTYSVYDGEGALIYGDDFRLNGAGSYNLFVSKDAAKIILSATTKENELPVYTEGASEFAFENDIASVKFTVSDEEYLLKFIKENDANAIVENISVNVFDKEDNGSLLGFEFDPYFFNDNLVLPENAASLSFDITSKEGADIKINGSAPRERYSLTPFGDEFEITATLGDITYKYLYTVEGGEVCSFIIYGDEGKTNFQEGFSLYCGKDNYTVLLPNEGSYAFADVEGCTFYKSGTDELLGSDPFTLTSGMSLDARSESGRLLFTLTLVTDNADHTPVVSGVSVRVITDGAPLMKIYSGEKLAENSFKVNYHRVGSYLAFSPVFKEDFNYNFTVTMGGTAYPANSGFPLFTGEVTVTVLYGDQSFDLSVTLTDEPEPPVIEEMGFSFFDAAANKIGYDAVSVKSGEENKLICTVGADVSSIKLTDILEHFCESYTVDGESTDVIPIGKDVVITAINGSLTADYHLRFEVESAPSLFNGFVISPLDKLRNELNSVIYKSGVDSYKLHAATESVFVAVSAKTLGSTVKVNGIGEMAMQDTTYIFYLEKEELGSELKIEFIKGDEAVETLNFAIEYATAADAPLDSLTLLCYASNGSYIGEVTVKGDKRFIDLPENTAFYIPRGVSLNGYLEIFKNGHLFPVTATASYKSNDLLTVLSVKDAATAESCDFTVFKGNYLSGISVNGTEIADFSPEKLEYTVILEEGVESVTLAPICDFENAAVDFESEIQISGEAAQTTVTVTNGDSKTVYTLTFKKAPSEPELLISSSLILNRETGFITNLTPLSSVSELLTLFENDPARIKIFKGTREVTEGNIATGMNVVLYGEDGAEADRMTLLIYGEITGDGRINTSDILQIILHNSNSHLSGEKLQAADINGDNRINSSDILRIILFNNGTAIKQNR
ncbi:MAG: hypothetical protein IKA51_02930 [Clostridia bacterium]|nr:hypothetical protein [Clostridia bacterium]